MLKGEPNLGKLINQSSSNITFNFVSKNVKNVRSKKGVQVLSSINMEEIFERKKTFKIFHTRGWQYGIHLCKDLFDAFV